MEFNRRKKGWHAYKKKQNSEKLYSEYHKEI